MSEVSEAAAAAPRVCDFYLQPRGCIKGDSCDFLHPTAPNGSVTSKLCDFFASSRGCNKGQECDFLHVEGKSKAQSTMGFGGGMAMGQSVCKFFQMAQGCKKGAGCEFLHPAQPMMGMGMGGMGYGAPPMMGAPGGPGGGKKQCTFFFTARGCVKGESCDFSHTAEQPQQMFGAPAPQMYGGMGMGMPHQMPGQPVKKPQKCDFFGTERGCIKGEMCDFIHTKEKVCDFFLAERGCRKGKFCDFQHPEGGAAEGAEGAGETSSRPKAKRYAPY
jgi:hypothetical protein